MKSVPQDTPKKKKYAQPTLKLHGSLAVVTATVGVTGNSDGGSGGMFRTH